jgi:hypothetical protein
MVTWLYCWSNWPIRWLLESENYSFQKIHSE